MKLNLIKSSFVLLSLNLQPAPPTRQQAAGRRWRPSRFCRQQDAAEYRQNAAATHGATPGNITTDSAVAQGGFWSKDPWTRARTYAFNCTFDAKGNFRASASKQPAPSRCEPISRASNGVAMGANASPLGGFGVGGSVAGASSRDLQLPVRPSGKFLGLWL